MSAAELVSIASEFVKLGVTKIRLTGGEPLVRKEFPEIVSGLAALGVELALTTNAILLPKHWETLDQHGLRSLNISLDTLNADRFERLSQRNMFSQVWENIQEAIDRGYKVKLNVVLMRGENEAEIHDFIRLTERLNVHVRFIEYMPFEGNKWELKKVVGSVEILREIENKHEIIKLSDRPESTSRAWKLKSGKGTFAVISTVTLPFCSGCNRLRLTTEGKMRNCLFAKGEMDLLTAYRAGHDIGDMIQSNLSAKAASLGGRKDFENLEEISPALTDRSMITIGG